MSSRVKEKEAKREARVQHEAEVARRERQPLTVALAIACLAGFIALRGADLQFTWGTEVFWGTLITVLIPAVFLVGLLRGDRFAWIGGRWAGGMLAIALVVGAVVGYPVPKVRLYAMALSLAAMVALLSTRSARDRFEHR